MHTLTSIAKGLYCPFLPQISPYVEAVENHTTEWVTAFNLHKGADLANYSAAKFGYMTSRFYPSADYEHLCITNDLLVLLFLLDDVFDHQDAAAQNPTHLKELMTCFMAVLEDNQRFTPSTGGNILAALSDVWQRILAYSSRSFQAGFIKDIHLLFSAITWQNTNANSWKTPTVAEYIRLRPIIGGAHIAARLIYFSEQFYLPNKIQQHSTVKKLTKLCGHLGCWANDLFSFSKEIRHGDAHNLVMVLKQERNLTIEQAIDETIQLHNKEMHLFYELYHALPHSPTYGLALQKYAYDLAMILRGNIDWSREDTARYEFNYVKNFKVTDHVAVGEIV